jgi:hypothetical protein
MKKLFKLLFTFLLITNHQSLITNSAFAADDTQSPIIALVDFPEYINNRNPEISYTALDIGEAGLREITLQVQKDGASWQNIGVYTEASRKVAIDSSKINSDGKYFFQATACDNNNNCATDATSTTIDTVAPPKPEGYSKEKTGTQTYKIKWHNPNADDLDKVYVYRSENQNFDLNSGTQISQVSVTKNTDSEYMDWVVPDSSKTYYYALRSVDKATNASDPVGDTYTTVVIVSPAPGTVTTEGAVGVSGLAQPGVVATVPQVGGQVLGQEIQEATPSATVSPSVQEEVLGDQTREPIFKISWQQLLIIGLGIAALILAIVKLFKNKHQPI